MLLDPLLGDALPYVTFFGTVIVAAWYGGTAPAVSATVLSFFTADYFFIAPRHSLAVGRLADLVGMVAFFASGSAIALLGGAMRNARLRAEASAADAVARRSELEQVIAKRQRAEAARREQEEWLQTTLGSIGDAVIATDTDSQVIFLNRVAAELTGWTPAEATGAALSDVFRILTSTPASPLRIRSRRRSARARSWDSPTTRCSSPETARNARSTTAQHRSAARTEPFSASSSSSAISPNDAAPRPHGESLPQLSSPPGTPSSAKTLTGRSRVGTPLPNISTATPPRK